MLRLFLLRHAKSSWAEAGVKDFDRGLNERGNSDLQKIAAMLKDRAFLPPQVFCSPALRTRLTMHGVILAYASAPRIDYVDRLYSGDAEVYVQCLMNHDRAESVMIIGHNPSLAELATMLVGDGDPHPMKALAEKFPTGALAVIDFNMANWRDLGPGAGRLTEFIRPVDL